MSAIFILREISRPIVAFSLSLRNLYPTTNSLGSRFYTDKFPIEFGLVKILIEYSFAGQYYFWLVALKAEYST